MGKPKSPLLSLGARGTVGDALTFARRRGVDIVQEKPIPAYRRTLPQVYQRWLYEDYAYLWTQQSAATQAQYRATGSRYYLTGFQYWMKYNLTNLPDINAWWRLDEATGNQVFDYSKNSNTGTIIGASPITGKIGGAYSFDGINDRIVITAHSSLLPAVGTLEVRAINKRGIATNPFVWYYLNEQNWAYFGQSGAVNVNIAIKKNNNWNFTGTPNPDTTLWHTWQGLWDGTNIKVYLDGILKASAGALGVGLDHLVGSPVEFGHWLPAAGNVWSLCDLDNIILYNRILDTKEIQRHSERSYP